MTAVHYSEQRIEIASYFIAGALVLGSLVFHLFPALFAGLLVYVLVDVIAPKIKIQNLKGKSAKLAVIALIAITIISALSTGIIAMFYFVSNGNESLGGLLQKMAETLEGFHSILPYTIAQYLPTTVDDLNHELVSWLRGHSGELQIVGKEVGRVAAHILIGMIVGGLIALHEANSSRRSGALAQALTLRAELLGRSFRNIVFAQIKIATINALVTALYLAVILPLLGIHLPLVKTMILVTFVLGLLPVVGNLLSNTVIIVVSLSHSVHVALGSLLYLVLIHKAEYFLNARIIGTRIKSHPWELLIAMLLFEAIFGLVGVVAAPIFYAYLKAEMIEKRLV